MEKVLSSGLFHVKMWLNDVDDATMKQVEALASLPFVYKHIALMPDAHAGIGMPIGGVLPLECVIIPNAVGVDIGCGMCAVKTSIFKEAISKKTLLKLIESIKTLIPLGFEHHKEKQDETLMPQGHDIDKLKIVKNQYVAALKQLGTLGGGNHFIEIQYDESGYVWLMLHSGSRNLGHKVAEYYDNLAKRLNKLWHVSVPEKFNLAYLPVETDEANTYYKEMKYCVDFAFANRKLMMQRIQGLISDFIPACQFEPLINIAHNYAAWEEHFGKKVLVHRKGATSAKAGETGIIPGSQGTTSYIVEGLGNPESFMSCSHGAGRMMSRTKAIKELDLEKEIDNLNQKGILHCISKQKDLDEAPSAYKDIAQVMAQQNDLVKIVHELNPLAVVKA